jgi:hypothetical protein
MQNILINYSKHVLKMSSLLLVAVSKRSLNVFFFFFAGPEEEALGVEGLEGDGLNEIAVDARDRFSP